MEPIHPFYGISGGVLIGLSATLLLALSGRIAGISGMVHGLLPPKSGETLWRGLFLAGLIAGTFLHQLIRPLGEVTPQFKTLILIAVGGFLVGLGTRMGNGCTSGHGVCGLGRLSMRSLVATLTFMFFGIATVYVVRHVLGVG